MTLCRPANGIKAPGCQAVYGGVTVVPTQAAWHPPR